jgi:hypothetical protein
MTEEDVMKDLNQQMQADIDRLIDQLDRLRNWLDKPTTAQDDAEVIATFEKLVEADPPGLTPLLREALRIAEAKNPTDSKVVRLIRMIDTALSMHEPKRH